MSRPPAQTRPNPTQADQTQPDQAPSNQSQPDPAQPDPAQPDPAEPDPAEPDPAEPDTPRHGRPGRLLGAVYRTRSGAELLFRHCEGAAELEACVALQRLTWGYADIEVTPQKSFMLAQELGGQVIGAFAPDGRLAGFAMSMAAFAPALDPATGQPAPGAAPQPYLHSHMLAVLPEYRDQGLGARLKLAQREDALDRGILRMTWTFDPLAAKNAHLNIHRLGAIARRYSPDFYGVSSSRLQAGLPTDRLHAEWWLASARVRARARAMSGAISGAPLANVGDPFAVCRTILLPRQVDEWKQEAAGFVLVEKLQRINREIFLKAFAQALVVTDFSRDASGNGVYGLAEWHPSLSKP